MTPQTYCRLFRKFSYSIGFTQYTEGFAPVTLEPDRFHSLADATLDGLMDAIESAVGDVVDVDLEAGILGLELDGGGQYVINKHAPSAQIWMSSPLGGASHYGFDAEKNGWIDSRTGARLEDVLARELSQATGRAVALG